jgi:iron complex transport system substrate-binding protein
LNESRFPSFAFSESRLRSTALNKPPPLVPLAALDSPNRGRRVACGSTATLALSLLACALAALPAPLAASADIRLPQADGDTLHLAEPAERIVTLSPHLAEGLYAAGAGDRLVATVEYSEFPPAAAALPRVGDAFRLDIERIVALQPDLVVAWDTGNPRAAVAQLRRLGLTVWSVEVRRPEEIAGFIDDAGRAAGTEAQAAAVAHGLRTRLERLTLHYAGAHPLDYFYQVDQRPLFTVNGEHLISRGLALCGGRNIFAGEPGLAFQASHESVILADPAAMFAPSLPGETDPLAEWRAWPDLAAVRNEALFLLPADAISRATPRFLDSLELACTLLDQLRVTNDNE